MTNCSRMLRPAGVLVLAGAASVPVTIALGSGTGEVVAATVGSAVAMLGAMVPVVCRGRAALPWLLVFGGALLWVTGDTAWTILDLLGQPTEFPSAADGVYLAGYPVMLAGVALLHRRRLRDPLGNLLEAAIVGTGAGLLLWSLLLAGGGIHEPGDVLTLVYPVADVICLVAFAHLLAIPDWRRAPSMYLVAGGLLFFTAGDVVYAAGSMRGTYASGAWPDSLWLVTYVLLGAAALHPSLWREPEHGASLPLTRRRLALLITAALVVIGTMSLQELLGHHHPYVFGAAGAIVAVLAFWRMSLLFAVQQRGVKELALQEQRFHAVFESSRDGMAILDDDGLLVDVNAAGCRIFGPDAPFAFMEGRIRELVAAGELYGEHATTDGGALEYAAVANALPGQHLAIVRDVTERRALEEQLRQAQKLEAIGQLAGGVAHDFNNLLMVINGYTDIALARAESDSRLHECLTEIRLAGQRAAELTGQLLTFGRRQLVKPELLDLNEILAEHRRMLARLLGEQVSITLSLDAPLADVTADRGQLVQVIVNLSANARDAMPGGGELVIATRDARLEGQHEGDWVVLEVRDHGTGMGDDVLEHLFEPFFTTKDVGQGTGLGLATVHTIVEQSGGFIEVESQRGTGTRFLVYLPQAAHEPVQARRDVTVPAIL